MSIISLLLSSPDKLSWTESAVEVHTILCCPRLYWDATFPTDKDVWDAVTGRAHITLVNS